MKAKRGDFGYINNRKKRTLTIAIIYSAISIGIYVLGLVLNHMSRQNLFTVIAVLGVLPIVKQIVGFVVVFPYHSVTEEQYQKVQKALPEFEYAKEAIKIGVEEYLLKPISPNVLLEHLGEVASKIHEKQKEYEQRERRIREMREKYLSFQKRDRDDNINSIKSSDADFDINSVDDLKEIQDAIADFLSEGSPEDVPHFVEALLDKMPREHFRSIILRQYVIVNIFATVTSFCKKFEDKVEKTQTEEIAHLQELKDREKLLREALATAESQEDIQTYMTQLLANALEVRNTVSDRRYSDVILAAQKIIKKQYMSEDISLNTVAAEVGMSARYFSTIFSREMNQTFVEYLTEIRMNKAKELLTCSSLKTAEIAFETGYRDPHYFSSLFKKTQGCTPKEYRASRKG